MKKALTIIVAVFLAVVLIGAVIYPNLDMEDTVKVIKSHFSPLISSLKTLQGFIDNSSSIEQTPTHTEGIEEDILSFVEDLEAFFPSYLEKEGLVQDIVNQGPFNFNVFATSLDEHKVALFAFIPLKDNRYYSVLYCGVCEKVVAIYQWKDATYDFDNINGIFGLGARKPIYPVVDGNIKINIIPRYYNISFDDYDSLFLHYLN